jgi:hypothetical protein
LTLFEVDYEKLVFDREAVKRQWIDFAGLDWNDACLSPEHNPKPITTASVWQARQPVYGGLVGRWRHYEPWLGELRQLLNPEEADVHSDSELRTRNENSPSRVHRAAALPYAGGGWRRAKAPAGQ